MDWIVNTLLTLAACILGLISVVILFGLLVGHLESLRRFLIKRLISIDPVEWEENFFFHGESEFDLQVHFKLKTIASIDIINMDLQYDSRLRHWPLRQIFFIDQKRIESDASFRLPELIRVNYGETKDIIIWRRFRTLFKPIAKIRALPLYGRRGESNYGNVTISIEVSVRKMSSLLKLLILPGITKISWNFHLAPGLKLIKQENKNP